MGRVGSCFDNAASEAFFSALEHEVLSRQRFATKAQAPRCRDRLVPRFLQPTAPTQFGRLAATRRVRKDRGHPTGGRIEEASTIRGEAQFAVLAVAWTLGDVRARVSAPYANWYAN
jgi:hypothetical protein